MTTDKLIDPLLEESVLGTILVDPESFQQIVLSPEDFTLDSNKTLMRTMSRMHKEGKSINAIQLSAELKLEDKLESIGGNAYLTHLISRSGMSIHLDGYITLLKNLSRRRKLIEIATEMVNTANNESDIEKFVPRFLEQIATSTTQVNVYPITSVLSDVYDRIMERYDLYCQAKEDGKPFDDIWGMRTGILDFDKITGGIQDSDMTLITGESGVGKTMLLSQMCHTLGTYWPGVIFSAEMNRDQIETRQLSAVSRVRSRKIKVGNLSDGDLLQIQTGIGSLEKLKIFICDASDLNSAQMRSILTQYKIKHGIKWFAFDYLYLLTDGQGMDENNKTLTNSSALKRCCRFTGLPALIIHSLNKAGQMRGSGQVKYDCDLNLEISEFTDIPGVISPTEQMQKNMVTCIFRKSRNIDGSYPGFHLVKDSGFPAFRDYEWRNI